MTAKKVVKKKVDSIENYNSFKFFQGQQYTGMKVGGHHKWYYEEGEWKEVKRTPDLWEFHYEVQKKRAGKAPVGSGVPIDTEYSWGILGIQNVKKIDANTYATSMSGLKFKIAHKRADKIKWSATPKAQRKRLMQFLQAVLNQLHQESLEDRNQKKTPKLLVK